MQKLSIRALLVLYCVAASYGYTTQEFMIPMRDGVKLYTIVFFPDQVQTAPTVLYRTPYGTPSCYSLCEDWTQYSFVCAAQDFRGRYNSQGRFDFWLNASTDAYDTMEWITQNTWSNQQIFTAGASALGIAQYLQPLAQPKWLVGQFIEVGSANVHQTGYQGGAFREALIAGWLTGINESAWIPVVKAQEPYSSYWYSDNLTPYFSNVNFPAVHWTGWYDIFNQQQLDAFEGYNFQSSLGGLNQSYLVVSPTGHCQGGDIYWPEAQVGVQYASLLAVKLFQSIVTGKMEELSDVPRYAWYVMGPGIEGSFGNFWVREDTWPNTKQVAVYLYPHGELVPLVAPDVTNSSDSYYYDPMNPVPTIGGNNLLLPCGPRDQSSLNGRSDILTYAMQVDEMVILNGHMTAVLYVSSNATDTDFTVKILDVFPNGTAMLLQDGIIRMRWRDSDTTPSLMTPGEIYQVEVDVWSTSYVFNAGHTLRVDISSSNYPRFTVNPNNGLPLDQEGPIYLAENTIYHDTDHPSCILLPVVSSPETLKPFDMLKFVQRGV